MGKFMKIAAFGLSACAMLALAQPGQATEKSAASETKAASAASTGKTGAKTSRSKKYCINVMPDTASRITRPVCKTKEEWAAEDVEVTSGK
jgi:hypothetical protein